MKKRLSVSLLDRCVCKVLKKLGTCVACILISMMSILESRAEVGDPCNGSEECSPGEVCVPGRLMGDPPFCTRVCNETSPCPDPFICIAQDGVNLCNTRVPLGGLGDPCDPACGEGLLCLDDGVRQYCSVSCTLPGSCPEGYRCQPGALNACAITESLPSTGAPCHPDLGCLGEGECLSLPNRDRPYCTYSCAELTCPNFMQCTENGEDAWCTHFPYERSLGDECVLTAADSATIGCTDDLTCEADQDRFRCTQDCTRELACPDGFGCVARSDQMGQDQQSTGRCLPEIESDPHLSPSMSPPPLGQAGEEMSPMNPAGAPPADVPQPVNPVAADEAMKKQSTGCETSTLDPSQRSGWFLLWALGFLWGRSRLTKVA